MTVRVFDRDVRPFDTAESMATLGELPNAEIESKAQGIEQKQAAREQDGEVAAWWADGYLHLRYYGTERTYRGSSVEGCDADDKFVRHLATELVGEAHDAIKQHCGADKIRIEDGEVHALGDWPRGDGGESPWWKFAGYIEDIRTEMARTNA